jgi:hypothetical protein
MDTKVERLFIKIIIVESVILLLLIGKILWSQI